MGNVLAALGAVEEEEDECDGDGAEGKVDVEACSVVSNAFDSVSHHLLTPPPGHMVGKDTAKKRSSD